MKIFVATFAEGSFEGLYKWDSMEMASGFCDGYFAGASVYGSGRADAIILEDDSWAAEAVDSGLDWDEVLRAQQAWEKKR